MTTKGGCFCGTIRYEFDAEGIPVADCHCTMCRRTSGAPYVTWLVVPVDWGESCFEKEPILQALKLCLILFGPLKKNLSVMVIL